MQEKSTDSKKARGRKKEGELPPPSSYPEKFRTHCHQIDMAREAALNPSLHMGMETSKDSTFVYQNTSSTYEIIKGDARALEMLVKPRPYTLCLMDIPYGFAKGNCEHNDDTPFTKPELVQVIKKFKEVTTAPIWRIVIIHSDSQASWVREVLEEENCSVVPGIWYKKNCFNSGGPRLNFQYEPWTIGLGGKDDNQVRSMEHFVFGPKEGRSNVVDALTVTHKKKSVLDGKPINVYQKPRKLLNWFVEHFSQKGDWVLDLFAGSGTGTLSALAYGRHCVAVEIDQRQVDSIVPRILVLDKDILGHREYLVAFRNYRREVPEATFTKEELKLDESVLETKDSDDEDVAGQSIVPFRGSIEDRPIIQEMDVDIDVDNTTVENTSGSPFVEIVDTEVAQAEELPQADVEMPDSDVVETNT